MVFFAVFVGISPLPNFESSSLFMNSVKRGGTDKEAGCFSSELEEEELLPRPRAEFCPGQSVHSHIPS